MVERLFYSHSFTLVCCGVIPAYSSWVVDMSDEEKQSCSTTLGAATPRLRSLSATRYAPTSSESRSRENARNAAARPHPPRWLSPPDLKPVLPESSFNRPRGACSFVRRPSLAASIGSAHRSWRLAPTGSACHPASKPRMPHADSRERRYARLACRSPPYHHLFSFKPSRNASPTRSVTL